MWQVQAAHPTGRAGKSTTGAGLHPLLYQGGRKFYNKMKAELLQRLQQEEAPKEDETCARRDLQRSK